MRTDHTDTPAVCEYATVYVAFELSKSKWQIAVRTPGSEKLSRYRIDGGDLAALSGLLGEGASEGAAAGQTGAHSVLL